MQLTVGQKIAAFVVLVVGLLALDFWLPTVSAIITRVIIGFALLYFGYQGIRAWRSR